MSQQRITLFFPQISGRKISPEKGCPFLELPYNIRRQIYFEAGMVSGMTIDMNHWSTQKRLHPNTVPFGPWDARLPTIPLGLFAVCHSVHNELRHILYGENRLAIARTSPRGLRALERLSNESTREIKFLVIHLNIESCLSQCCEFRERRCGNGYNNTCKNPYNTEKHDPPLSYDISFNSLGPQWERICVRLADARPDKLSLFILADCANYETAEKIVTPLLQIHHLQDCGIRLARDYDEEIQTLAQRTVLQLTHRKVPPPIPPFRFLDLPKEIQLRILEDTSLVSLGDAICESNCARPRMFIGSSCRTQGRIHDDQGHNRQFLGCFCMSGHSAFNFRCTCKGIGFPHSFFLVSRSFRELSTVVFYSQNRFRIAMPTWRPPLPEREAAKLSSIRPPLLSLPRDSIKFLTYLYLDFDYYGNPNSYEKPDIKHLDFYQPTHPFFKSWKDAISLLSLYANLPILHLEVRFAENWYPTPRDALPAPNPVYKKFMLETYERMIGHMINLKGLKDFFVHLNWSSSCTGEWGEKCRNRDGREEAEWRLERMVMGSEYDAWRRGKVGCFCPESFDY